ncbi:hypothetical protein C8Q74DRAFT_1216022 [Fomes fomentarius]|nr:hypothetical protein C8Q74DRAFT_1216022 [Fomes fomentarius]
MIAKMLLVDLGIHQQSNFAPRCRYETVVRWLSSQNHLTIHCSIIASTYDIVPGFSSRLAVHSAHSDSQEAAKHTWHHRYPHATILASSHLPPSESALPFHLLDSAFKPETRGPGSQLEACQSLCRPSSVPGIRTGGWEEETCLEAGVYGSLPSSPSRVRESRVTMGGWEAGA